MMPLEWQKSSAYSLSKMSNHVILLKFGISRILHHSQLRLGKGFYSQWSQHAPEPSKKIEKKRQKDTRVVVREAESRTKSISCTILGPPLRFCKTLISLLIFFERTAKNEILQN